MHTIKYKLNIDEVTRDVESNYFLIRDCLYRILIIILRDLKINDIIIEDNSYNGLMNMFISNNENERDFLMNSVKNKNIMYMFLNIYDELKLLVEKIYKEKYFTLISLSIINSNEVEVVVKYLTKGKRWRECI